MPALLPCEAIAPGRHARFTPASSARAASTSFDGARKHWRLGKHRALYDLQFQCAEGRDMFRLTALCAAMVAVVVTTNAQDSRAVARCTAIDGDPARLSCFDDLARKLGLSRPQPRSVESAGMGKWQIAHDRNPVDDTERVVIALFADKGPSRLGTPVTLVGRCQSNKTEAYIDWGTHLGNDSYRGYADWKYVTTRIGTGKAQKEQWPTSADKKTTFAPQQLGKLLKEMAGANSFLAQVTPYNESPITAIFDTTGMAAALAPLAKVCGWGD
jgi:type VI secretion system protein VasI